MWTLFAEEMVTEEEQHYTAYGVRCGEYCIGDFCTNKDEAESFVDTLNKYEVSTVHAADIIEDYFGVCI